MRSGGCSVPEAVGVQWELPGAVARRDQSQALLAGRGHFMRSSRPSRAGSPGHSARGGLPALMALPALLRASHLLGLALGSALGRLRDSGVTLARMFEKAEESALLLRMTREAAGILGARWDKVPERHRPHYAQAALPDPAYPEFPRPVATRDGGDVLGGDRHNRAVGDGNDDRRRRGPTSCASLRALPPASGGRRSDTGRGLLRTDASASLRDPASSRQAGRRPVEFTVSRRVPRCGAAASSVGSKSCLKGRHEDQRSTLEGSMCAHQDGERRRIPRPCAPTPAAIPIAPLHLLRKRRLPVVWVLAAFERARW